MNLSDGHATHLDRSPLVEPHHSLDVSRDLVPAPEKRGIGQPEEESNDRNQTREHKNSDANLPAPGSLGYELLLPVKGAWDLIYRQRMLLFNESSFK